MDRKALVLHCCDNVATCTTDIERGTKVEVMAGGTVLTVEVLQDIPFGHKFALKDLPAGAEVLKYGKPIGKTTRMIRRGEHVHTHNLITAQGDI